MKNVFNQKITLMGLIFTLLCCTISLTGCGSDDDVTPTIEETLSVNVSDLSFTAEGGTQTFNITASGSWEVFGQPNWMNVSPQKGQGNTTITVNINSSNLDSAPRTATLTIISGEKSMRINISQAGAYATCEATVKNLVALSTSAALQFDFTTDVKNVRLGWAKASYVQSLTEQELIELVKSYDPLTPDESVYIFEDELIPNTDYYILSLAYDKNDKMGKLCKQSFKTKSNVNQCIVDIDNLEFWKDGIATWYATPNNNGNTYYSLYINGLDPEGGLYYFTYLAWIMNQEIKKNNFTAVQKHIGAGEITEKKGYKIENQKLVEQQSILHGYAEIVTWGVNLDGELSGIVNCQGWNLDLYGAPPRKSSNAQMGHLTKIDATKDKMIRGGILLNR